MSRPLVSLRGVEVELGGVPILRGVNAGVERGRVTALIGLNGSGKSTLLRTVLGENPYRGEIKFHCGHDHTRPRPEHVGYVPQRLQIDARLPLTVRDLLGLALQRRPLFFGFGRAVRRQMDELLGRVGASALLDRPVEKLSGGELQRVLLGLALHPNPELLLLDEPAAGIDFKDQQPFYDLIGRLNADSGVTVLLVSHDLTLVNRHAHHVLCLRDGKVQCEGSPAKVITPETLRQVFGSEMAVYPHDHHHGHAHGPTAE